MQLTSIDQAPGKSGQGVRHGLQTGMKRFGIYFTPSETHELAEAARRWLGRDIWSSTVRRSPEVAGISAARMQELLRSPRHYGFHATIKPPFRMPNAMRGEYLSERLANFAANHRAFHLPELELTVLSDFFCLRPKSDCAELFQIAADTVQYFDDLRLPPTTKELNKRRAVGLTANQESMLQAWGYPYVMNEFRFHLTLTGRTSGDLEKDSLRPVLAACFPPHLLGNVVFDNLSLFVEEDGQPMCCVASYPLQSFNKEKPESNRI